jgi:hypothetical protein
MRAIARPAGGSRTISIHLRLTSRTGQVLALVYSSTSEPPFAAAARAHVAAAAELHD